MVEIVEKKTLVLKSPTVADVIAALAKMPQDAKCVIHDADTDEKMSTLNIGPDSEHNWMPGEIDIISIWGDYHQD